MQSLEFEEIIAKLPEIAEAVNAFASEELQRRAFEILVSSLGVDGSATPPRESEEPEQRARSTRKRSVAKPKEARAQKSPRPKKTAPKIVAELNLRPHGKPSLRDFMAEKKPSDNQERFAVLAFYLKKYASLDEFNQDHVLTAFKEIGARVPTAIESAMRMTAQRKGWLDASDISAVSLTINGENFVEHDLPPKAKK